MFWKKNAERIAKLEEKIEALGRGVSEGNAQIGNMTQSMAQLQRSVREQGMSVEDLLEEWNERKADDDGVKERFREYAKDEQRLLELFEAYQDQFWNLRRFAEGKDEAWAAQISMMEKSLEHYRQMCGISIIGECGADVDYDLHEVIDVVETDEPGLERKVALIYQCGYLHKGRVVRKAKVAAYSAGNRAQSNGQDAAQDRD